MTSYVSLTSARMRRIFIRMTPSTLLIFGHGQLGEFYRAHFEKKGVTVHTPALDIRDSAAVGAALDAARPDLVINTAAKTNIDWCEQNKTECFAVNTLGAAVVGEACAARGVYLVHLSSGCVQESKTKDTVWGEGDPVSPLCFYAWTKVWAENLLRDAAARRGLKALILRPRQLLSSMVSTRNAVTKLLTYSRFIDAANSCTIVEDLMGVTEELIRRDAIGTFNVVNPGVTSPYEIALLLKEIVKPEMVCVKIEKDELNHMTLAKRVDTVLSTAKLNALGIVLPEIHARLREILAQFKRNMEAEASRAILEKTEAETRQKLLLGATTFTEYA